MKDASANSSMPEIPASRSDDIHNIEFRGQADLTLFMAGNQFMVMDELLRAFQRMHPGIRKIFYETLPPGLELRQILAGGARFNDIVIDDIPDIYTSVSAESMETLKDKGLIDDYSIYLRNRLVIMTPAGNPASIRSVTDLAAPHVRISQPGPMEDITDYIVEMYRMAGGDSLVERIMEEKRAEGTTIMTVVHHRESPLRLRLGTVDAAPVWATEAENARRSGLPIEVVEPGEEIDQRDRVNYCVTRLKNSGNPENGRRFLEFLLSPEAQRIYRSYGFLSP